jgi:hypothetical protein
MSEDSVDYAELMRICYVGNAPHQCGAGHAILVTT